MYIKFKVTKMDNTKQEGSTPKIMITKMPIGSSMDLTELRKDPTLLRDSFEKRGLDAIQLSNFLHIDKEHRDLTVQLYSLREQRNKISKAISKDMGNQHLRKLAKELDTSISELEKKSGCVNKEYENLKMGLPNLVDPLVPLKAETTLSTVGIPKVSIDRVMDFEEKYPGIKFIISKSIKPQYIIIKEFDFVDEKRGSEISGQRFYYKKNELVMLDMALSLYAMKKLMAMDFKPIVPPYLVRKSVEAKATSMEVFEESLYKIEGEDLYLIPTAEHPIAAYHSEEKIDEAKLPLRYAGYSTSFRKEAGASGKDIKGIYRNHHFNKVEQYVLCMPQQVEKELTYVINNQGALLNDLNIPFRVIILPAWDMDKKAIFHVDVEGWFPGKSEYGELGSHATVGTWQASRFNIKYVPKDGGKPNLVHTIYGTMVPIERTLACMLENNLNEDGTITVPNVLANLIGINELKPHLIR
jgi:seryl-tRNA synthetase